ncbi:hypothetical protein J4418_01925 [Candidatus Woesearchaeota archaeon]|nr:hypothetical protein [Candidatus Woesearchaeota archaeon]
MKNYKLLGILILCIIGIVFGIIIYTQQTQDQQTQDSDNFGIPNDECEKPCLDPITPIRENPHWYLDLSMCKIIFSNITLRDNCYYEFALKEKGIFYCGSIENDVKRVGCFSALSSEINYLDCGKIKNNANLNECYTFFAVFNTDISICQNIDNGHIGSCYISFASNTNNSKICDRIRNIPNCYGYRGGDFPTNVCYKQNCYKTLDIE